MVSGPWGLGALGPSFDPVASVSQVVVLQTGGLLKQLLIYCVMRRMQVSGPHSTHTDNIEGSCCVQDAIVTSYNQASSAAVRLLPEVMAVAERATVCNVLILSAVLCCALFPVAVRARAHFTTVARNLCVERSHHLERGQAVMRCLAS